MAIFRYTTAAQFYQRLRLAFARVTGINALRVGKELSKLSDAQLKALFGYTNPQTASLRTKLNAMLALIEQVKNQAGE